MMSWVSILYPSYRLHIDTMDNKLIAVGIVAVLLVAGIGGAVLLAQSGNKSSDGPMYEFEGKWNLQYMESVSLVDENDEPYHDANDCVIESRTFSPTIDPCVLEILEASDHAFSGRIHGMDIGGTFNGVHFTYQVLNADDHKHYYLVEGVVKEKHLSVSTFKYGVVGERHQMCGVAYSFFVRDGEDSISPRIDWANYHFPKDMMEHVYSVRHIDTYFEEGSVPGPQGTKGKEGMEYVKSDTMITLFNLTYDKMTGMGLLALVSLGVGSNGNAYGATAGHFNLMGGNVTFVGSSFMSTGKLLLNLNCSYHSNTLQFMELVYNVPYFKGAPLQPTFLQKEYVGTMTVYNKEGEPTTNDIDMVFQQYDRTVYGKDVVGTDTAILFGKINGRVLDIAMRGNNLIGHYEGHVHDDGTIHLSGKVASPGSGFIGFVVIELNPKEA